VLLLLLLFWWSPEWAHRQRQSCWYGAEGFKTVTPGLSTPLSLSLDLSLFLFAGSAVVQAAHTAALSPSPASSPLSLFHSASFFLSLVWWVMGLGFENPPCSRALCRERKGGWPTFSPFSLFLGTQLLQQLNSQSQIC